MFYSQSLGDLGGAINLLAVTLAVVEGEGRQVVGGLAGVGSHGRRVQASGEEGYAVTGHRAIPRLRRIPAFAGMTGWPCEGRV